MSKQASRPWTDEEMGYVLSTLDRPQREVSEHLGRPIKTIASMRHKGRSGWSKKVERWTEHEDGVISSNAEKLSAVEIAKLLPGRAVASVTQRRMALGIFVGHHTRNDPHSVGSRPLIAKTCTTCGLLLPGRWFAITDSAGRRKSSCKKCTSSRGTSYRAAMTQSDSENTIKRMWYEKAQALTIKSATRKGQEYTEADHAIMSDPAATNLSKALAMGRTYAATQVAVSKNGYKSAVWRLGDPEKEKWLIDNPNADRIDEIMTSLGMPALVSAGRPAFEWDD